jgi:hypothetical protein
LLLLLNATCLVEKQQIPILQVLGLTQPGLNQGSTTPNQAWTKDLPHSTRPEPRIYRTQPGLNQASTAPNQAWTKELPHSTRPEPRIYCTQPGLNQGFTTLKMSMYSHRDLLPTTKFAPLNFFYCPCILPRFNLFYFYFSSISHLIACTDLLNNPFCNDLSHNLSFGKAPKVSEHLVSKRLSFLELFNVWIDNWVCVKVPKGKIMWQIIAKGII